MRSPHQTGGQPVAWGAAPALAPRARPTDYESPHASAARSRARGAGMERRRCRSVGPPHGPRRRGAKGVKPRGGGGGGCHGRVPVGRRGGGHRCMEPAARAPHGGRPTGGGHARARARVLAGARVDGPADAKCQRHVGGALPGPASPRPVRLPRFHQHGQRGRARRPPAARRGLGALLRRAAGRPLLRNLRREAGGWERPYRGCAGGGGGSTRVVNGPRAVSRRRGT